VTVDEFDLEEGAESAAPVWAVFGDLMAGLLGAFVLILLCALGAQLELASRLDQEVRQHQLEEQRRQALERALAVPLAGGRVTLDHGRIGINGSVLFAFNSADLQPEGRQLLASLAGPLTAYLGARDEILMVSGFTDDRQVRGGNRQFADNWELSAQRALTVTRALVDAGVPAPSIFAAAFGAQQPVASNADAEGRARNRRVEMAPTPRPPGGAASAAR
jgi:flagellar motor protein MotB